MRLLPSVSLTTYCQYLGRPPTPLPHFLYPSHLHLSSPSAANHLLVAPGAEGCRVGVGTEPLAWNDPSPLESLYQGWLVSFPSERTRSMNLCLCGATRWNTVCHAHHSGGLLAVYVRRRQLMKRRSGRQTDIPVYQLLVWMRRRRRWEGHRLFGGRRDKKMPEGDAERGINTPDLDRWSVWIDPGSVSSCWGKRCNNRESHLKSEQTAEPCQHFKPDHDETLCAHCIPLTHTQSGQKRKNSRWKRTFTLK